MDHFHFKEWNAAQFTSILRCANVIDNKTIVKRYSGGRIGMGKGFRSLTIKVDIEYPYFYNDLYKNDML